MSLYSSLTQTLRRVTHGAMRWYAAIYQYAVPWDRSLFDPFSLFFSAGPLFLFFWVLADSCLSACFSKPQYIGVRLGKLRDTVYLAETTG